MTTLNSGKQNQRRSFFAGWAVSLALHVTLFFVVGLTLRGCQQASVGQAGGEVFRDVGLFVVEGHDEGESNAGDVSGAGDSRITKPAPEQPPDAATTDVLVPDRQNNRVPTEAPDLTSLLNDNPFDTTSTADGSSTSTLPPLIGAGEAIGGGRSQSTSGNASLIKPSEAGGTKRIGGTGGPGETTFMNISGVGQSFVYIIDTSSSMAGSRLKVAQVQLKASLRLLQPNQKFAVIFYNDEYRERLKLRRQDNSAMYFATDVNKELAGHEVDRITADRGTAHMPALIEAISLKPDVIYFLTDGDEPELSPAQLAEISRLSGSITIHVVKFGDGTLSSRGISWLQRIASQSNGEYREIPISNR
ncbi:MAG: VWA domain-containing protein [Planctomycetaceae bacterium]|nr:VWA domain-containing protein [Planctomycetaceae bacterium]